MFCFELGFLSVLRVPIFVLIDDIVIVVVAAAAVTVTVCFGSGWLIRWSLYTMIIKY